MITGASQFTMGKAYGCGTFMKMWGCIWLKSYSASLILEMAPSQGFTLTISTYTLVLFHFMFVIYPFKCHLSLVGILPLENLIVISLLAVYKEAIIYDFSQPSKQVIFQIHLWASDHFAALFHGQWLLIHGWVGCYPTSTCSYQGWGKPITK